MEADCREAENTAADRTFYYRTVQIDTGISYITITIIFFDPKICCTYINFIIIYIYIYYIYIYIYIYIYTSIHTHILFHVNILILALYYRPTIHTYNCVLIVIIVVQKTQSYKFYKLGSIAPIKTITSTYIA